jgi:GT2 family glycosyltransferase
MDAKIKSEIKEGFISPVDIIIPFHNECASVTSLLEGIMRFTKGIPYRITLVDDCSSNGKYGDNFKEYKGIQVVKTQTHSGFGAALEVGFNATHFPYVLFMHSDCRVETATWLKELGNSLMKFKINNLPIKMVSARSDNPGDECDEKLKGAKEEAGSDAAISGTLPLYCALFHRELFQHISFIKPYPYAWYEDQELSHRMKKRGFLQGVSGKSWVKHIGGLTINKLWKKKPIREQMEKNRDRCIADMKG